MACPLGTFAASQSGGGVSLALACQVNKERGIVMTKFIHIGLYVPWFSNVIIHWFNFRIVPLVHIHL